MLAAAPTAIQGEWPPPSRDDRSLDRVEWPRPRITSAGQGRPEDQSERDPTVREGRWKRGAQSIDCMSASTLRRRRSWPRGSRRAGSRARHSPGSRRRRASPPAAPAPSDGEPAGRHAGGAGSDRELLGRPGGGPARGGVSGRSGQPAPSASLRQGAAAAGQDRRARRAGPRTPRCRVATDTVDAPADGLPRGAPAAGGARRAARDAHPGAQPAPRAAAVARGRRGRVPAPRRVDRRP